MINFRPTRTIGINIRTKKPQLVKHPIQDSSISLKISETFKNLIHYRNTKGLQSPMLENKPIFNLFQLTVTFFLDWKLSSTHIEIKGYILSQYKMYVNSIRKNHQSYQKNHSDTQQVGMTTDGEGTQGDIWDLLSEISMNHNKMGLLGDLIGTSESDYFHRWLLYSQTL